VAGRGRLLAVSLLALLCLLCSGSVAMAADTIVSLEFDDGTADQYLARSMLSSHNMQATFFVNSGTVGASSYHLTWREVHDLASDGNEIAGHTVHHVNLPALQARNPDEARREVCNDRLNLINRGFQVTDFAYPYGAYDATSKAIAQQCGYESARDVSGVVSPGSCSGCPTADMIPPGDPYRTRTPQNVLDKTPLSQIEGYVTQAEQNGGGWVQIVLHHVCRGCYPPYAITQPKLSAFLDWLAARSPTTSVQTVQQVISGQSGDGLTLTPGEPSLGSILTNWESISTAVESRMPA
jgi:peptidoglycan/xylan/chitin deacetylase (PgdA/CDA1 family)